LPVYNGGDYLSDAIKSILNQSMGDFEFIILNDGSTDASLNVIRKYAQSDNRIRLITRENKGLIYTLNEGIKYAQCRFIARMDQDDISIENRLELQYKHMIEHDLDVCGGDYSIIDEQGRDQKSYRLFRNNNDILLCLASNVPFPHPSVMLKKDFLISKGLSYGMNGYRQAEDLDLWLNMFNAGARFGNVDSMIFKYRILSTSMSRINHKKILQEADRQFDIFMKDNIDNFEKSFRIFFSKKNHEKELEQVAVKAAMRWLFLQRDFTVLMKCLKTVNIYNFIFGLLSFFKLKSSNF
jgi:glycosyltransferase involved in cell wall biosynthesis